MKLTKDKERFIAQSSYEERAIPKSAGFRWDPDSRHWYTLCEDVAAKLAQYAEGELRAHLEPIKEQHDKTIAMSRASDSDIDIPVPDGYNYLPYQRAGIAVALTRESTLFADEMGLGKTIEAVGVINADENAKSVLVVCPATLKINWRNELSKWLTRPMSIEVVKGSKPYKVASDVVIINWDILSNWRSDLMQRNWDILIADEAHYAKNPKAGRTIALVGKEDKREQISPFPARRKLLLTGTPILNHPVESWPLLHYADPQNWPNFFYYAKRYCGAYQSRYGWDFSGATNLEELQDKLRSTIMVRRLKNDVLTELPAKRRQIVEVAQNGYQGIVQRESEMWSSHEEKLQILQAEKAEAKRSDDKDAYKEAVEKLRSAASVAFTEMSAIRHELAVAKIPSVIEHIENVLESTNKIVVFAWHTDVIDALCDGLSNYGVAKIDGRTPADNRQDVVDHFQTDDHTRVFVGNIRAAGVGITLTAASTVIFAELDWVPANITQAEDRLHRIGQLDSVLVQHLVVDGSLDARMTKTLVAKQEICDRALDKIEEPDPLPIVTTVLDENESETHNFAKVPDGRYAIPTTEGHLAFYRVTSPVEGRWAGYIFLEQQLGPKMNPVRLPNIKAAVLSKIAENPKEAMLRYGKELGVCGHCGLPLTNEVSREKGIGPICESKI